MRTEMNHEIQTIFSAAQYAAEKHANQKRKVAPATTQLRSGSNS
jgi:hypothetical protein